MNDLKKILFLVVECIFIVVWLIYCFYFYRFYNDVILFGEGESSIVIQLLLIIKYRGTQLTLFLLIYFVIFTINLYNIVIFYFNIKNSEIVNSKKNRILIGISGVLLTIFMIICSYNVVYIIFIPLSLLSITIVYLSYLISKYTIGKKIILKEEVLGIHGPFSTEVEMCEYISELEENYKLEDIEKNISKEETLYFVEFGNTKENQQRSKLNHE